jgi:hypothetical protein
MSKEKMAFFKSCLIFLKFYCNLQKKQFKLPKSSIKEQMVGKKSTVSLGLDDSGNLLY